MLIGVFQEKYKFIFVREIMEFWMSRSYIRKSGVPFVFIERAWDKEEDFIFHCTADIKVRSLICNFGLVYLPRSMARVWELVLNCAIAILYLWFFTVSRYGAIPDELLILLYVLDIGYILAFCIFVAHSILNWSVTIFLHSDRKFDDILSMSIKYLVTSSLTLVTHVVKPT